MALFPEAELINSLLKKWVWFLSWKTLVCYIHSLLSTSLCVLCVSWGRELTHSAVPSKTVVSPYRGELASRNLPPPHIDALDTNFPGNKISDWWLLWQEETFGTDRTPLWWSGRARKNLSDSLWLCSEHKQEIHFQRAWNPQVKRKKKPRRRKSDGWITNSSEASRDCSHTSYIVSSICIVHLEQQQLRCFEIKNNLEGANKRRA